MYAFLITDEVYFLLIKIKEFSENKFLRKWYEKIVLNIRLLIIFDDFAEKRYSKFILF